MKARIYLLSMCLLAIASCSKTSSNEQPVTPPVTPPPVSPPVATTDPADNKADSIGQWAVVKHWDSSIFTNYTRIQFPKADTGIIVDEAFSPSSTYIRTVNGGSVWSSPRSLAPNNQLVRMMDGRNGIGFRNDPGAVGGSDVNYVLLQTGANTSYTQLVTGVLFGVSGVKLVTKDVACPSPQVSYALFENGSVWRLQNPATNYKGFKAGETGDNPGSLYFVNNVKGWMVGTKGLIMMTNDSAKTWTKQLDAGSDVYFDKVYFVNDDNGWATTLTNTIYRTTNGGKDWAKITIPGPSSSARKDILFVNATRGFLNTYREVLETTDGGLTWKRSCKMGKETIRSICFDGVNKVWAISSGSEVRTTPLQGGGGTQTTTWTYNTVLRLAL